MMAEQGKTPKVNSLSGRRRESHSHHWLMAVMEPCWISIVKTLFPGSRESSLTKSLICHLGGTFFSIE
jgi:hypothetical protein